MSIEKELDKALQIVESRLPKVGIWWYINGKVYAFEEDYRDVEAIQDVRDTNKLHYDEWDKLGIKGDYDEYERGRILMDSRDRVFIFACSKELSKDRRAIIKIARYFSLPLKRLKIVVDPHYTIYQPEEVDTGEWWD